ncbi:MAG TPA: isochorismatase family protein [Pseudonocardiaceae bacterium]|nr:isochorismatase family protein [Pseudonocardiaceae bacterium]
MGVGVAVEALIVVDLQVGLVSGAGAVPDALPVLERIGGLLARAREGGVLTVHLQNDGPVGAVDEPGTPGWQFALPVEARELVVRKSSDDGERSTRRRPQWTTR